MRLSSVSKLVLFVLTSVTACAAQSTLSACSGMALGVDGALNGFVPSSGDAWHQDISSAPVDPNSTKIITTAGDLGGAYLHPDFSTPADGNYGIPYTVVDSSQTASVPVAINLYIPDSDITLAPVPSDPAIEGAPASCPTDGNDRHMIILDRNKCVDYEYWQAGVCNGSVSASNTALWDMTKTEQRPYGLTSADAAGLSVFEGLVRYDEIVAGVINHAIRFTANFTKADANNGYFVAPATHAAGNLWGTDNIIGMRIRLKANVDISGFSQTNQIILTAMKKYGMILADNGSNLFFQGTPDPRWDDNDLDALKSIPATDFEVVQMPTAYDSATAPTGAAPTIQSFTASQTTITPGESVTLTPVVQNASYNYVDKAGFVRGDSITVAPTTTTTYTLTSRNAFGTSTASVTVNVSTQPVIPTLAVNVTPSAAGAYVITATSNSPATVNYAIVRGAATVSGNIVTASEAGTVTLSATQAATGQYAAGSATVTWTVATEAPGLAVKLLSASAGTYTLSSSSSSPAPVTYTIQSGPGTISGNVLTATGAGTIVIAASQVADGVYSSASAAASVTVSASNPNLAIKLTQANASTYAITATTASPAAITYTVQSGPGTISGNVLTATGTGAIVVTATQPASGLYSSASASGSVTVGASNPDLAIKLTQANATTYAITATTASPAEVTYAVQSGPGTISGNVLTATGSGTIVVAATQPASGLYSSASVTGSVTATVSAPAPNFNLSLSSASGTGSATSETIAPGQTATYTFTASPVGTSTFPAVVNLSATGLPSGATYTLTPASIAAGASATTVTLKVTVPQQTATVLHNEEHFGGTLAPAALALLLVPFSWRKRRSARRLGRYAAVLLLLIGTGAAIAGLTGCGASQGFSTGPQQAYNITITGTSGTLTRSTSVTLNVQ